MGIPTNPNQDKDRFRGGEPIRPPQIEWIKNDPKTTKHMPTPESSWLQSISYDPNTQRMTFTTKVGSSWQVGQIGDEKFKELQKAPSKGSYYTKNIKGVHPTTPIISTPRLRNFPKEPTNVKPKDTFQNPLYDHFFRYKGKGGYT